LEFRRVLFRSGRGRKTACGADQPRAGRADAKNPARIGRATGHLPPKNENGTTSADRKTVPAETAASGVRVATAESVLHLVGLLTAFPKTIRMRIGPS